MRGNKLNVKLEILHSSTTSTSRSECNCSHSSIATQFKVVHIGDDSASTTRSSTQFDDEQRHQIRHQRMREKPMLLMVCSGREWKPTLKQYHCTSSSSILNQRLTLQISASTQRHQRKQTKRALAPQLGSDVAVD